MSPFTSSVETERNIDHRELPAINAPKSEGYLDTQLKGLDADSKEYAEIMYSHYQLILMTNSHNPDAKTQAMVWKMKLERFDVRQTLEQ